MTFKTLCEHILQYGVRENEMCGCYVYKDDSIYCEEHEFRYVSYFENIIKFFRELKNMYI